jgi:NAD(P)-dependent dehydrogenase (short-subunit alcohol dehydrogenase family)
MNENSFDLRGKVALVTGGNGGIGLGMAEAMARAGADICIWGTNAAKNAAALKTLSRHGVKTMALQCGVSSKADVDASFAETLQSLGRVDGVFANAGMSGSENSFLEITEEKWRCMLGVNLDGVFSPIKQRCVIC